MRKRLASQAQAFTALIRQSQPQHTLTSSLACCCMTQAVGDVPTVHSQAPQQAFEVTPP